MSTITPLKCQRHLFEMPDDVAYFDAAAWSPIPRVVREAGEAGIRTKSRPWSFSRDENVALAERTRGVAARMIGATTDDIAIVGSVSHAMATAARNIEPAAGGRILRVADEFPSLCFAWDRLAAERDMIVEIVPRPPDGDWTAALLEAIGRPGAPPLAAATLTPLHWMDGTIIDLDRIAPAVHAVGAELVVDATQVVGAMPVDVHRWQPDFLVFPTYKWALGPYGTAFLYAAPHRQGGVPIEENAGNRPPAAGARCFDRGERNDPVSLWMAATALELVAGWDMAAVAARSRELTDLLADGARELALTVPSRTLRAPHILGLRAPGGFPADLVAQLKQRKIFASERGGGLRLSPHVWSNEADLSRCLDALGAILR